MNEFWTDVVIMWKTLLVVIVGLFLPIIAMASLVAFAFYLAFEYF